jgi:hypothetical protein
MSTWTYSACTRKREDARKNKSKKADPPGFSTYIDTVAAMVPIEILPLYAYLSTHVPPNERGPRLAAFAFCFFLCCVTYLVGHVITGGLQKRWQKTSPTQERAPRWLDYLPNNRDFALMFIPAVAFVAWTMLQKDTLFDAVWPTLSEGSRNLVGVVLGLLAAAAAWLNSQLQNSESSYIGPDSD